MVDPDARRGKHGSWYDGYLLDVAIDSDSELITALNVLPANGDEAGDAAELVRQEETAHGNDIQSLSIDGLGFQGPVLRELESPEGPALEVSVPPTAETPSEYFKPQEFVEDPAQASLTCPAGQTTFSRERNTKLSELVRRHGARRARYRGRGKVLCGQLMAATAVNVKRIIRLLRAPTLALGET